MTYHDYLCIFYCAAALGTCAQPALAGDPQPATSRYVKFELEKCPSVEEGARVKSVTFHCKMPDGFEIFITKADRRYYVGFGPNGKNQRAYHQTLSPFNTIRNVIELRFLDGAPRPHAAILRYFTQGGGDGTVKGQVLVAFKLTETDACQVGYVDTTAHKASNGMAVNAADNAQDFDCAKDEPRVIGMKHKSPM